jgi:cation diffusion facilitator CzcD-associated flavoprotein CzcO
MSETPGDSGTCKYSGSMLFFTKDVIYRYPNLTLHTPADQNTSTPYHLYTRGLGLIYKQCFTVRIRMCLPLFKGIACLSNASSTFPKYIPKGKLANFLDSYAVDHELCIWLSSSVQSTPVYDSSSARWTVEVQRGDQKVFLNPKHVVLATGSGSPRIHTWNGMDEFQGALYHSDFHKDAEQFRGKRVVVVGAVSSTSPSHTYAYTHENGRAMPVQTSVRIL